MSSPNQSHLKCDLIHQPEKKVSRRDFLGLSALWACVAACTLSAIGLLKFPKPALLPDVSNIFKIGRPEDIPANSEKIIEDRQVLIKRDKEGIMAISLICTHLGCVVSKMDKGGFSCPCHGSKFTDQGLVAGGPAPRELSWLEISQLPNGKLVVNAGKRVPTGTKFVV